MPLYSYRHTQPIDIRIPRECSDFDAVQAIKAEPFSLCPDCSGPVERIIIPSGTGFQFKGGAPTPRFGR